jgi:hypothetical protein
MGAIPMSQSAQPSFADRIDDLLLTGLATTVFEAEEQYLDSAYEEVLELLRSPLTDEELGRQPLMVLYRSYGSPQREDSLVWVARNDEYEVVSALESVGVGSLVMGGHAIRFYGLTRTTVAYDFHVAPSCWDDLAERLRRSSLAKNCPLVVGPSWRSGDFRRFRIGELSNGRDE